MDQETINWFRFAKLLTDVGAKVLQELLNLLIRTSCLNIYVDCWLKNVKDRCYPNCLPLIMSALTNDCINFDASTKQIHQALLQSWRGKTGPNTMRMYQQIQILEEMELNIKDHLKMHQKQLFSLTKWLNRIRSEKVKQVYLLNQLTKWHREFTECISVNRQSLLDHMDLSQSHISDVLVSIQKSLAGLIHPSRQDVTDLVNICQNDLTITSIRCHGELMKFYVSWLPKLGDLVDSWKLNLGNTYNVQNLQMCLTDLQRKLTKLHSSCNSALQNCYKAWFQDLQNTFCNWQQMLLAFQGSSSDLRSLLLMWQQDIHKLQSPADKHNQEFFKSRNVDLNRLLKRKVIDTSQWLLLFPSSGCPVLRSFDITLLYTLLRNICSICPPQQGWNDKLSDTDLSTGADLQRIKSCRNHYVAHISKANLSTSAFNELWSLLESVICRLAFECGQDFLDEVKRELLHLQQCEFDASKEKHFWVNMISWCMSELHEVNQFPELLENQKYTNQSFELLEISMQNSFKAVQTMIQSNFDKVENNVQNQALQLSEKIKEIGEKCHADTRHILPRQVIVMYDQSVQVEPEIITPTGKQCYDPYALANALGESPVNYQTDALAEYRLRRNCECAGLQFLGETPGDGNCFFESVSSQLDRLSLPRRSARELRASVVHFLLNNRAFQGPEGMISLEGFVQGSYEDYCLRMSREGEYADHVAIIAMARMLERDIMIVTSSPGTGPDQSIIWVVGKDNFGGNPVLLAHIWENHYESLEQKCSTDVHKSRSTVCERLPQEPIVDVEGTAIPVYISQGEDGIICVTKCFSALNAHLVDETVLGVAKFILMKGLISPDEFDRVTHTGTSKRLRCESLLKKVILGKSDLLICFFNALKAHCPTLAKMLAETEVTDEDRKKFRKVKERAVEDTKGVVQEHAENKLQDFDIKFFQLNLCESPDVVSLINDAMVSRFVFSVLDHSRVMQRKHAADKIHDLFDKLRSSDIDAESELESIIDCHLYEQWMDGRKERRKLEGRNLAKRIGLNFRAVCRHARQRFKMWKQERLERTITDTYQIERMRGEEKYLIFLSYSSYDMYIVRSGIMSELEKMSTMFFGDAGHVGCSDTLFRPGRIIAEEIDRFISCSSVIVFVVSKMFLSSQWCQFEYHTARLMFKPIMYLFMDNIKPNKHNDIKYAKLSHKKGTLTIDPDWNKVWKTILKMSKSKQRNTQYYELRFNWANNLA